VIFSWAVAAPENTMPQAAAIKIATPRIPVFVTFFPLFGCYSPCLFIRHGSWSNQHWESCLM
jgi:hypothetical protein